MNGRVARRIHKRSKSIATEWLSSMLSASEASKINDKHLIKTNTYSYDGNTAYLMPYSVKGSSKIIKMIIKSNPLITIESIDADMISEYLKINKRS
jgi:hypothetical protein